MTAKPHVSLMEIELVDGKAPEWIHIAPIGRQYDPVIAGVRDFTPEVLREFVSSFEEDGQDVVVDWHHSSWNREQAKDKKAPAAGFISALELRDNGLWGKVTWNDEGREDVEKKRYRFQSGVFMWNAPSRRAGALRPRLHSVALTNTPQLTDLTPLVAELAGGDFPHPHEERTMLKKVRDTLVSVFSIDLADDAGEDQIVEAILGLKGRVPDELNLGVTVAEAVPKLAALRTPAVPKEIGIALGNEAIDVDAAVTSIMELKTKAPDAAKAQQLETTVAELVAEKRTQKIDDAIAVGKFTPAERPTLVSMFEANPALAEKLIAERPATGPVSKTKLPPAGTPDAAANADVTVAENRVMELMGVDKSIFEQKPEVKKEAAHG